MYTFIYLLTYFIYAANKDIFIFAWSTSGSDTQLRLATLTSGPHSYYKTPSYCFRSKKKLLHKHLLASGPDRYYINISLLLPLDRVTILTLYCYFNSGSSHIITLFLSCYFFSLVWSSFCLNAVF